MIGIIISFIVGAFIFLGFCITFYLIGRGVFYFGNFEEYRLSDHFVMFLIGLIVFVFIMMFQVLEHAMIYG